MILYFKNYISTTEILIFTVELCHEMGRNIGDIIGMNWFSLWNISDDTDIKHGS